LRIEPWEMSSMRKQYGQCHVLEYVSGNLA